MEKFNINNRRYIGNKSKLLDWIFEKIKKYTKGNSFLDIFSGTGSVSKEALNYYDEIIINDFLFSNNVIYKAFFGKEDYDKQKLRKIALDINNKKFEDLKENYFDKNFGNKYFGKRDARKIGFIRDEIEKKKKENEINEREYNILLSSLVYSIDKIANTVGHYEAYIKKSVKDNILIFNLIKPLETKGKKITIFREEANKLGEKIKADIVFLDPPYNSRQYSRFYHLIENLIEWEKPELFGVALKPKEKNMSDYCRNTAPKVFDNLVKKLNCKYIVVTYNNTYNSKSSSSKNKISFEEILKSLNEVGKTKIFEKEYKFFNAGKTDFKAHKEFLFITEVK
jgi:site-specific DNA-methyltransferase (adenine-specific)